MKAATAIVLSLSVLLVIGCASPQGGGMSSDEGFKIFVPVFDKTIKQGETRTVTINLDRGKYFKRDVTLSLRAIAEGITVEPATATVLASDPPGVPVRITVPKNAALGEYKVRVTGTPSAGEPTTIDFAVKVVAP